MAEIKAGIYSPETAKMVLEVVRYLQAAGYVTRDGQRGKIQVATPAYLYVKNDSGEEIPAHACMQATGTVEEGGQNYVKVDKPADSTGLAGAFIFNGPDAIEIAGYGIAFSGPIVRALGDGSSVTSGAKWQPASGSWEIAPGGTMATAIGADDIATDVLRLSVGAAESAVIHAKTPGGGIAGMTGLQMASASCDRYACSAAGLLSDSGDNVTIYNPVLGAIAATTLIVAARNSAGLWVAIVEDCG